MNEKEIVETIDVPELDELLSQDKTDDNNSFKVDSHPAKCRCEKCGHSSRGKHPARCRCKKCLHSEKQKQVDSESTKNFVSGLSSMWKIVCNYVDNRFKNVQGYERISKEEIELLSDSTAHVLAKYVSKFGYLEEITLITVVIVIFGSRFQTVLNESHKKKQDN